MKTFKTFSLVFIIICFSATMTAQDKKPASPPATATGNINGKNITVNYSSPYVKSREIWGGLVPYGKVWRAGANAPTTFEFDKAVKIEGNDVPAGKYSFYIIPEKDEFILIFGKDTDMPAYKYNDSQDQLRVKVKPRKSSSMNESLVYNINKKDITLSWENLDIPIVIE